MTRRITAQQIGVLTRAGFSTEEMWTVFREYFEPQRIKIQSVTCLVANWIAKLNSIVNEAKPERPWQSGHVGCPKMGKACKPINSHANINHMVDLYSTYRGYQDVHTANDACHMMLTGRAPGPCPSSPPERAV